MRGCPLGWYELPDRIERCGRGGTKELRAFFSDEVCPVQGRKVCVGKRELFPREKEVFGRKSQIQKTKI